MKSEFQSVEKVEKRIWQLILLSLAVILYLTLSLLGLQFFRFIGHNEIPVFAENAYEYSVFLSVLVLLFVAYLVMQQRRLLRVSKALFKEKESASTLSENVKILTALFEVTASINSRKKLTDILDTITRDILNCFEADQSSIMLLERDSKCLRTMSSIGKGSELSKDALLPVGEGVSGWVVKNGEPLLLNGTVNPTQFPGTPKKSRNISSSLCVPLKIKDRSIGVLNVNLVDRDRSFSDAHLKLISIFANNAAVAIQSAMLDRAKARQMRLQRMFEQLHSPKVVKDLVQRSLLKDEEPASSIRKSTEMTVLFADIRGFTDLARQLDAERVAGFLDEFYRSMSEAVSAHEGNVDKFIGDEVMAFFGGSNSPQEPIEKSVAAARDMVHSFLKLKEKFAPEIPPVDALGLGIGVNSGEVIVGHVGSQGRYDYTVIGTAVNLARRLCSFALSGQILVTEQTLRKMSAKVSSEFVKALRFKGIPETVNVFSVS